MSNILDFVAVGVMLVISAGYAVTSLGPKTLRQRLLAALARGADGVPRMFAMRGLAARLRLMTLKGGGSCGGCDTCGSTPKQDAAGQSEVHIPIAKIGRRA